MVTSKLPHKGELALADSSSACIGSFKPTGFSRWWFSVSFGEKTPRLLGEDFSTIGMRRTTGQRPTPCMTSSTTWSGLRRPEKGSVRTSGRETSRPCERNMQNQRCRNHQRFYLERRCPSLCIGASPPLYLQTHAIPQGKNILQASLRIQGTLKTILGPTHMGQRILCSLLRKCDR